MFSKSIRIVTVWGIPIKLHVSLLLLLLFVLWKAPVDSLSDLLQVLAFLTILFGSIAAHELGHSYVAIRQGCRVREITLLCMGGAAQMEQISSRPRDEIRMALAGPAVSLTLGLMAGAALLAFPAAAGTAAQGNALAELGYNLLLVLGFINMMLAIFNLLPAFPMDGGRVLRAALTPRLGRLRATDVAARLGRFLAVGLVLVGIFGLPGVPMFNARDPFPILIGLFVFSMAGQEFKRVRIEEMLRQGRAAWPFPIAPPPDHTIDENVIVGPPPYARREHDADDRS